MKIGLFDPYLDTLGGGERYTLTLAAYLLSQNHQVEIFWSDQSIIKNAQNRFNLKLSEVKINSELYTLFTYRQKLFEKFIKTRSYDVIFHLSDGSLPFLFAKKNIVHFQVPFQKVNGRSLSNKIKLQLIHHLVCNSKFTKTFIDQEFGVNSQVIYPPIDIKEFSGAAKKNLILSVGRFDPSLHSKKQEIMIEVFRQMLNKGLTGWELVLIGGLLPDQNEYFNQLKQISQGLPITLLPNLAFSTLKKFYSQAKIYWHAAGYGVDENLHPEKVEHFGITTIEAMAAGCVPLVCQKGGQKEIVDHSLNGFLWTEKEDLVKYTQAIIKNDFLRKKISSEAIKKSQEFSQEKFCQKFQQLITKDEKLVF